MMLRSLQVRWQLRLEQISSIARSKRLWVKTQFTIHAGGPSVENYTFVLNPGKKVEFLAWAATHGLTVNEAAGR